LQFPLGRGGRPRELRELTRRISALRAEVDTLEETLVRTPTLSAEAADPDLAIRQLRRALLQEHLSARTAELALLTERPHSPEERTLASRGARVAPIVDDSIDAAVQGPLPEVSSATVELTPGADRQTFGPAGASEEEDETLELEDETLELEPVGQPLATNGSGATLASASSSLEPTGSAGDTAVPEATIMEKRAAGELPDACEVEPQPNIAMLPAEAVGPLPGPSEGQMGIAVAGSESVASLPTPADPAESVYGARQLWRGAVAVLTRGGPLTLVAIGALLALTRGALVPPGSQMPEPVAPVAAHALMAPPIDAGEREPDGVGTTIPSLPAAPAAAEPSDAREIKPEPDGVAEPERESVLDVIAEPPGQPPSARENATIRAPGFAGVNLRRAPSTSAATIRVLATGTRVELLGGQVRGDGLGWQQVLVPGGGTGWVVVGTVER